MCGTVNKHNYCVGSKNPHNITENEHDSPKVNVWCTLMKNKVINPLFIEESHDSSAGIALGYGLDDWGSKV
jgi:hypothetical protein